MAGETDVPDVEATTFILFSETQIEKINSQIRKNTIFMATYLILTVLLIVAELFYFRIADHFNIIDKPNERSSHSSIVLRGGGDFVCG